MLGQIKGFVIRSKISICTVLVFIINLNYKIIKSKVKYKGDKLLEKDEKYKCV